MRFESKQEFAEQVEKEHLILVELLKAIPGSRYGEKGVWGDGWSIRDLLAHLTEWEQMFLSWYRAGRDGTNPILPAPGFKWNETPRLNRSIWLKYSRKSSRKVLEDFAVSYEEITSLIRQLSEDELLVPGHLAWTGKYPLTTYMAPNTCSHYRFASKVLRRWQKQPHLAD